MAVKSYILMKFLNILFVLCNFWNIFQNFWHISWNPRESGTKGIPLNTIKRMIYKKFQMGFIFIWASAQTRTRVTGLGRSEECIITGCHHCNDVKTIIIIIVSIFMVPGFSRCFAPSRNSPFSPHAEVKSETSGSS